MEKVIQFIFSIKHRSCTYSLVSKRHGSTFSSAAKEEEAEGVYQEDSPVEETATEDDNYDTPEQNDLSTLSILFARVNEIIKRVGMR